MKACGMKMSTSGFCQALLFGIVLVDLVLRWHENPGLESGFESLAAWKDAPDVAPLRGARRGNPSSHRSLAAETVSDIFSPLQAHLQIKNHMEKALKTKHPTIETDSHNLHDLYIGNSEVTAYLNKVVEELPKPTDLHVLYDRSIPSTSSVKNDSSNSPRMVTLAFSNAEFFKSGLVQNWLCSLQRQAITNFVLVAIDQEAADAAAELGSLLPPNAVHWDPSYWTLEDSNESLAGKLRDSIQATERYLEFTWRRNRFVSNVLNTYPDLDVIISDADTTWNHVPWKVVPFQREDTSCDMLHMNRHEGGQLGDELRDKTAVQAGFLMLHNTPKVRNMYDKWLQMALMFHEKEQPSLRTALSHAVPHMFLHSSDQYKHQHPRADVLHMCVLDRDQFPTSQDIFGNRSKRTPSYLRQTNYWKRNKSYDKVTIFHPTISEKHVKPQLLQWTGQWFWDEEHQTCIAEE